MDSRKDAEEAKPEIKVQSKDLDDTNTIHQSHSSSSNPNSNKENEMEIVKLFRQYGLLIKQTAVDELKGKSQETILEIIKKLKNKHTEELVFVNEAELKEVTQEIKLPDFADISRPSDFRPLAKEFGHEFKVNTDRDVTGRSKCNGDISDFVKNVNDRFQKLKGILESRPSTNTKVKLERANKMVGEKIRVIGMISRKNITKKGHLSLELEDEKDTLFMLVLKDNEEAFKKASRLVKDDVVAIDAKVGANYCMAEDVTWPDMPVKNKKTIEKDLSIGFISDMHIGSKYFDSREFEMMIKWLKGSGPHKDIAEKIGYLFVVGDVADGIGNYPTQEKDLIIKDVFEQYKTVHKLFEMIPDHIKIIMIPGNHDSVRLAEPQPAISKDLIGSLPNLVSIGNPGYVNVEGFESILYHGVSIQSMTSNIPGMNAAKPEEAVIELLKRRNLAPIYDENDIAPEHTDYHFIKDCDIITTGHMHKNGYTEYRGTVIVTSGTWQELTEYQVKQGHIATPCLLPVYNLKEGRVSHLSFKGDEAKLLG